eukprot:7817008-Pyramimonas_sp.AAC.1
MCHATLERAPAGRSCAGCAGRAWPLEGPGSACVGGATDAGGPNWRILAEAPLPAGARAGGSTSSR